MPSSPSSDAYLPPKVYILSSCPLPTGDPGAPPGAEVEGSVRVRFCYLGTGLFTAWGVSEEEGVYVGGGCSWRLG